MNANDGGGDEPTPAWMLDSTITPQNASETISREKCVTLAFDKEKNPTAATAVLRIDVPFAKSGRVRSASKDEYATEERLGPLKVKDHGMRVAPDCGLQLVECRQFLFRKFADNVTLHTLTLSPTYVGELGAVDLSSTAAGGAGGMGTRQSMLHGSGLLARGVSCFFSHAHHGFMYDVTEETAMVANYVYTRETNFAAISQFLLYVSSVGPGGGGGVDVYTIRNALATRAEAADPPDISFLCQKFLFSPVGIDVAGRNVCVMVKQESQAQPPGAGANGNDDQCFNVYALRTSSVETMVNELLALGKEHAKSNW